MNQQLSHSEKELLAKSARERVDIVTKYDRGRDEGAEIDPWEDPAFEVYHVTDRYGFIHENTLPYESDASEYKSRQIELQRTNKWVKMTRKWDKYYPGEKLTRRVYKGIPERLRGDIWCRLLDVYRLKQEQRGVYEEMKERARRFSPDIRQIDLDVNRTYRNHIMFRQRYDVKQQHLFHVLAAYSMYNAEVGYCQGMSQIAALLLMYMNEEEAFWGLSSLLTNLRHGMHGFFVPGFPKLLRFQDHHDRILKKFLPKVRKHLDKNDIYSSLYTIKWFLQCFLDRVPVKLTLRLWDIYMLDGEKILVGMAYNILKMHKRRIMKMQMEDLVGFFQGDLEKNFHYTDDQVIDHLTLNMEELRRHKKDIPPKGEANELPTQPFGLFVPPSVDALIGRRTFMSTEKPTASDKRMSSIIRPYIPADGGPESLPPGVVRQSLIYDDNDAQTDGMSSVVDFRSSKTSFMDQSDVASTVTTMSRPTHLYSSFNTLNDTDFYYKQFGMGENGLGNTAAFKDRQSPSQSQVSEYDNLNSFVYEQDLERTLESMELDGNATFKRGMTLTDYNGFDDLTPRATPNYTHVEPSFQFHDAKENTSFDHKHFEFEETTKVTRKVSPKTKVTMEPPALKLKAISPTKKGVSKSPVQSPPPPPPYVLKSSLLNGFPEASGSKVNVRVTPRKSPTSPGGKKTAKSSSPTLEGSYL